MGEKDSNSGPVNPPDGKPADRSAEQSTPTPANTSANQSAEPSTAQSTSSADDKQRSGRAGLDSRGNPIWEWQMKTGVYGRDIDTQRMKVLRDRAHLSIADDPAPADSKTSADPQPGPKKMFPGKAAPKGGGFNPYDSGTTADASSAPRIMPSKDYDPLSKPLSEKNKSPAKPGLLRRLFGKS